MTLRGPVSTSSAQLPYNIDLVPRSQEYLPDCISVVEHASLCSKYSQVQVSVAVKNNSIKNVFLNDKEVLAELQFTESVTDIEMEALVGTCAESPVKVNNIETKCLLDSGSQVRVISETFLLRGYL